MSALGQKQTFAMQKGMSALPPDNADIHERDRHVRLVPISGHRELTGVKIRLPRGGLSSGYPFINLPRIRRRNLAACLSDCAFETRRETPSPWACYDHTGQQSSPRYIPQFFVARAAEGVERKECV